MTVDFHKKFQLTDSLLRRLLNDEDYEHIKVIEPVIVMTDEPVHSKLKNPVYKHAVVSSKYLYIVNTPAKQDSDMLLTLDMEKVINVQIVYDVADFLQGDLREQAQHIRITCKQNSTMADESLSQSDSPCLDQSGNQSVEKCSLSANAISLGGSFSRSKIPASSSWSPGYKQSLTMEQNVEKSFHKGLHISDKKYSPLIKGDPKHMKRRKEKKLSEDLGEQFRRPLPKPLDGTEKINASYTNILRTRNTSLSGMIPSKSCNNLSSIPRKLTDNLSSSLSLSQSWNELIKAGLDTSSTDVNKKESVDSEKLSLSRERVLSFDTSSNLEQSVSSRMFRFFAGKQDSHYSSALNNDSRSHLLHSPQSSEHPLEEVNQDETSNVHIFTVDKISKLYNVLNGVWIQSLVQGTYEMVAKKERKSSTRIYNDTVLQKFSKLKEEILNCEMNDQFFLLTKEIKYACRNYLNIKKKVWKSSGLIKLYLRSMKSLVESTAISDNGRMDEIDMLILIGEFFICIFQGSEMFQSRNIMLNENSASVVRQLIQYATTPLRISSLSSLERRKKGLELELEDLMDTWMDCCVGLLCEIINAANQSSWCCLLQQKSFDVTKVGDILGENEKNIMKVIDHVMQKLTSQLSDDFDCPLFGPEIVQVYKEISFLHFVCMNCSKIKKRIATYHQEEIKYYIGSSSVNRIPKHYSLYPIIMHLLSGFLSMVT